MKIMMIAAAALALTTATAYAGSPAVSAPGNSCLWAYQVDHTTVAPDTKSIVFHLRNGSTVTNTLPAACNGLALHGFSYVSRSDQVCNGQGIRIIESGQVCMLGSFGPTVPASNVNHS